MISSKELEQFTSDMQKLLEPLEAEIQLEVNITEEDFNKDMSEDNDGQIRELLQRGNKLKIGDDKKREEIRLKQQLLQSKYKALKDLRSQRRKKKGPGNFSSAVEYKRQSDDLLKCLDDIEKKIIDSLPEPKDEQKLKMN
ncbi:dystrophin-like [Bufo gargarizans]|uniref:dystrophin-like n=1 Tax=Bufo gargarizans TaxID=30331 RepID=UPI001CF386E6|nr:dystrophin-like [Bufo gargarizans]